MRYGNYDLHRGDSDNNQACVDSAGSSVSADTSPSAGESGVIKRLQQDLRRLGFLIVGSDDGIFGPKTEWAIREFQIYSKMPNVAAETGSGSRYVDRLTSMPNTLRYNGPVSGVVDADTRARLQHWLTNNWRCPVVIEAWNMDGGSRSSLHAENIWWHNDVVKKSVRMYVRDFTGYYDLPAGAEPNDLIVLGSYVPYLSWSGPLSKPPDTTWPSSEILPEALVGVDLDHLSAIQRSTFKVVRAVSEVECIGFFDCLNAYDNAFVSGGPCHWTLGIVSQDGHVSDGELCGYLAYLQYADYAAFSRAVGFFGVQTDESWISDGTPNGRALFSSESRKYVGWVAVQQQGGAFKRLRQDEELGNYFKSWHWFYRFAMAGRTVEGWRRRMWDMARIRIRDILGTPFPAGIVPDIADATGRTRRATIGDVYTSEKALAVLLRWHIRYPAHVIAGGRAGRRLCNAFARAAIPTSAGHPAAWTDVHERQLLRGLIDEIDALNNADFQETIDYVVKWPKWADGNNPRRFKLSPKIGSLNVERNAFRSDGSGLPPAPWSASAQAPNWESWRKWMLPRYGTLIMVGAGLLAYAFYRSMRGSKHKYHSPQRDSDSEELTDLDQWDSVPENLDQEPPIDSPEFAPAFKRPPVKTRLVIDRETPGLFGYYPPPAHKPERKFGIAHTVDALKEIGLIWSKRQGTPLIGIGDISKEGGGKISGHDSHRKGIDVDIRPLRNDDKPSTCDDPDRGNLKLTFRDREYSRELTQEFVDLTYANGKLAVQFVFFNDLAVENVRWWKGHDNHLHVRFHMPGIAPALPLLRRDSRNPAVRELQRRLGFWVSSSGVDLPQLEVDGDFGQATDTAVRAFQSASGLTSDGKVGDDTWELLPKWL